MAYQYPFADPEFWSGSYYTLDMQYAAGIGAKHLLQAVHTLWHQPLLEGPVAGRWSKQALPYTPLALSSDFEEMAHLNGLMRLPNRSTIGCSSEVLCYGYEATEEAAALSDCVLTLSIPEATIKQAYAVEAIDADEIPSWVYPFERTLMEIAEFVYRVVPFAFAIIGGEDVPAFGDGEASLTAAMLRKWSFLLTPELAKRLSPVPIPETLPSGLLWFPWISERRGG